MAGDWIKMRGNLWDDPRIAKLCDLTDQPEAMVVGGLYWLWATADQHTEDGILPGLTLRAIDRKTGIKGFGDALVSVGWLADHPEGVRIVNFEDHNGASAKKRAVTAKRVATHRSVTPDSACSNDGVTQAALQKEQESVTGALAREREEKEKNKDNTSVLPGFAEFWETWPTNDRKQAKGKCLEAWKKASAERDAALVVNHVRFLKNSESWRKNGGEFIPAPLVYLNQRRWEGASESASGSVDHGVVV